MGLNYYQIKKNILRARKLVIKGTTAAGSGHPGGSFSMAEIMGCIFHKHLKYDPKNPDNLVSDGSLMVLDSTNNPQFMVKYSDMWPNISKKRESDIPEDQEKWREVKEKFKYFSEKPGKGD